MDLPYSAEYAKSGRSSCRGCKSPIAQGSLRLAVMVQSAMFDGKTPQWYHYMCFFSKQRPKTVDDIAKFESLRLEDQKKIQEKLSGAGVIVPEKKGKKRDAAAAAAKKAALKDFTIEYAKSGRAGCRGCELKIMKDEIRISKKDYETEVGMKYGGQAMWHHLTCFAKLRSELGYFESADKLPGFKTLKKSDQEDVKKELPAIKQEDVPEIKKAKTENTINGFSEEEAKLYAEQNKIMFKYRDQLEKNLSKDELIELLQHNDQEIPPGKDRLLERLADIMTFGTLLPCDVCKEGQLVFDKFGYRCRGDLTEWSKCNTLIKEPQRATFKVPANLSAEHSFLKKFKYVARTRVCKDAPPSVTPKKEEENSEPKIIRAAPPLYNMEFVILGQTKRPKEELKVQIAKLGGKVITKISESVMAVISTEAEVEKMGSRMSTVKDNKVHVVPEDFVDEASEHVGKIPEFIVKKTICDWGSDPKTRLPPEASTSKSKSGKSASIYTSKMPSKVKLTLKGGTAVDPDSGLDHKAHVYTQDGEKYTVVLSKTDIQTKKNSYYKLQLLQSDRGSKYWVFRAWGRIGTTIGGNKVQDFNSLHEAKTEFYEQYEDKTGNMWQDRHDFQKLPGRFYPIDVDYGDEQQVQSLDITDGVESKLALPVQNLIRLIFDVKAMQKVMLEFELDTEKMPLGKLSKKQIQNAYSVLTELQRLVDSSGAQARFIDASNRFYTFVPHSFGVDDPPILNDTEAIKQKITMLDSLMELEIAYNLMKSSGGDKSVDSYYSQLNTEIDVLSKDSEDFKLLAEYVRNTHAATHSEYTLDIQDIFTVKRQGEEKRFKPFKKLHNRKLLWHGSRTTNFAGILAQGLRIAPPEAPSTGYMFGKGIYFADMVSKSANYCCTSVQNSTGLLLLCDVALGNMYEQTQAEYVEKLPKGKHSTKGVGRTQPDPSSSKVHNGVEVPLGTAVTNGAMSTSLLYNEYIVYDVAQVNVKYLLKVNFQYKY